NLYFFLGKNFLVTVHAVPSTGCDAARDRLLRSPDLLARGVEMTMHHIIDQAVDSYFPLVEGLNGMVDGLEQKLFEEFDEGLIHDALGFWVAAASMVGVSLAIVWWLKHRKWL